MGRKESVDIEPEKKEDQMKQNVLAEILADAKRLMHNSSIHDPIPSENDEARSFPFAPSFTIFAIVTWTKSLLNTYYVQRIYSQLASNFLVCIAVTF